MHMMLKNFIKKFVANNPTILGLIAYCISSVIYKTLRVTVITDPEYNSTQPYLFAFWHGKQFLPVMQLQQHQTKKIALVSPSRDGSILEVWLNKLGYKVERGSSRDGNVRSLISLLKKLRDGFSVGFGIDGPTGPIYQAKPGIIFMAQKCNVPIVPLAAEIERKWIFSKAWDKYELPKPFSKVVYCIGKPIHIPDAETLKLGTENLAMLTAELDATLQRLHGDAAVQASCVPRSSKI
jgi:lysophospholipid acyltransferase (LPLAT)-like uncharacterized protein